MTDSLPLIVVSSGEPAGIGPDICLALAARAFPTRLAVLGDPGLFAERAAALGIAVDVHARSYAAEIGPHAPGSLEVLPIELRAPVTPGTLDATNAAYVLDMLREGTELCTSGEARALVTAPVQKSVIAKAGFKFTGHTEFLAELTGAAHPVMLLTGKAARVALVTTHLPLADVPKAIDRATLESVLRITHADLQRRFRIDRPRMLVLGLNPHAGESGTLGTEEIAVIEPTVRKLAAEGLGVLGPVSADTAFTPESLERCDVVVAMFHDQGLPALKALSFGEIVNVTLAGTGRAVPKSLFAAVDLALALA